MRHRSLSHVRHLLVFGILASSASSAIGASRACLVSDVRYVTARSQIGVQMICEGGRYRAGLLDELSVYRGRMGDDEITVIKAGDAKEGQVYRCREIVKALPREWTCELEP